MSLAGLVRVDGRTHGHPNRLHFFIFANVVFLGVSYKTYCREKIHTKNAVRERVIAALTLTILWYGSKLQFTGIDIHNTLSFTQQFRW